MTSPHLFRSPRSPPRPLAIRIARRSALAALGGAIVWPSLSCGQSADAARCPRCGGRGQIPIPDARPLVWVEGAAAPKPETLVAARPCPVCRPDDRPAELIEAAQAAFETTLRNHAQWEERTGWKLHLVVTRHAAIHSQMPVAQSRSAGQAVESFLLHVKKLTGSLALAATRPDKYEIMLLWERKSWDAFRQVMEQLYTREQLGEYWAPARDSNSYDHAVTPHLYQTPATARALPPSCGVVFLAAWRQINLATHWKAPFWLAEGFATYADHHVHKVNRWFTVYDAATTVPAGDWLAAARKLAADDALRPWPELLSLELHSWATNDYPQAMAAVAFLLESQPAVFLQFLDRLQGGAVSKQALEAAYGAPLAELSERFRRWLLARR